MTSPSEKLSRVLLSPAAWEKMACTRARPFFSRPAAMELDLGRVRVSPKEVSDNETMIGDVKCMKNSESQTLCITGVCSAKVAFMCF